MGNAIVNIVNDGIASLTPGSIKKKITKDENYTYFDFIYYQKKKFDNYVFNRTEVFSQGIVYYTKQMLVPIDLQFIHKREVPNLFLAIVVFAVFFLGPVVFYYFKKDKLLLLIPGYIFSFLMPYLGVSFITFFYWSNVSDRYTYYFLVIYAVILGLIVRYFPKYSFRIILIYAFIMQFQAINYGFKFNTPHRLYEEIITYKPHPAIYSLLFEQYYIKLDLQNCEKVLKEGLEKFPENISLQQDAMKIENLRNYYRQVKNVD